MSETIWLRHRPDIRIGTKAGRVVAYDPAYDLCLIEWEHSNERTSHEVGFFIPPVQTEIRKAAAASMAPQIRPPKSHRWLDLLALIIAGALIGLMMLSWATAAGAHMRHRMPHHVDIPAALAVAEAAWPGVCQPIIIEQADLTALHGSADAVLGGSPCVVTLDLSWPAWSQAYMCSVMVHEVGHLDGQMHSSDPASPMYPVTRRLPQCPGVFHWHWGQWS